MFELTYYVFAVQYVGHYTTRTIGLMRRVFANGPGDWGSIPGRIISTTQKMVLDAALLSTQHYKVQINPGKGVALSSTPRCSSY